MSGLLIILAVLFISLICAGLIKKNIFMKVYFNLNNGNYVDFFRYVDSNIARAMMPIYTREFLKLNAYIKMKNDIKVTEQFNRVMKMQLTNDQLNDLLVKAFNYFSSINQKKKCAKILNKMAKIMNEHQLSKYQRHYDIIMDNSTEYIKSIESSIKEHRGKMRGYLEYLLARSYQNKNDQKEFMKHLDNALRGYKISEQELEQTIHVM